MNFIVTQMVILMVVMTYMYSYTGRSQHEYADEFYGGLHDMYATVRKRGHSVESLQVLICHLYIYIILAFCTMAMACPADFRSPRDNTYIPGAPNEFTVGSRGGVP